MMLGLSLSLSNPSTGGGGSTVPAWVPAQSTGFIDFENSRAWLPGVGTIADLTTVRNASTGDCIGALFDRMALQDYAALVTYEVTGPTPDQGGNLIVEMNDGGSSGLEVYTYADGSGDLSAFASSFDGSYAAAETGITTGDHFLAIQLNAAVGVQSAGDGGAVVNDGVPYVAFTQTICQLAAFNIANVVIKSICLYENGLTTTQLQALSSLGVLVPDWFAAPALAGATGGVDWSAINGAAFGQAFFDGLLITDLTTIHGPTFSQAAVTAQGIAITDANSNHPTMIGALLDALTAAPYSVVLEGYQAHDIGDAQSAWLFATADDYYDPSSVWNVPYVVSDTQIVHVDISFMEAAGRVGLWPTGVASKLAMTFHADKYYASANGYPAASAPHVGAFSTAMIKGWLGHDQAFAPPYAPSQFLQGKFTRMIFYPGSKGGAWCETASAGGYVYQGGAATEGSADLTLDSVVGINVGDLAYGFGVTPGSTVLSISAPTVTLSATATGTGTVKLYAFKAP